jgi:hypothetical protein
MVEVTLGMFVDALSAKIRDELWTTTAGVVAVLIHPDNTEQDY